MSVRVDEVSSEIQVEPEPDPRKLDRPDVWAERERIRAVVERLRRDALRVESRGFDD